MAVIKELPLNIGIQELLDAGLHFGHQSKRWNPRMKRFVFEKRNGIYVIDLAKTLAQLKTARQFLYETVAGGRQVLFIGTKKACQEIIQEAAGRCHQHYVTSRWLGGTLTNHHNIARSVRRLREIEDLEQQGQLAQMPQKEASRLRHELARLQRNLRGIAEMRDMPGALMVVDINREAIAVREAIRTQIPVVAMVDTNCNPDLVQHPIPGNDDSIRGCKLIINLLADAILAAADEYQAAALSRQAARETAEKEKSTAATRIKRERKPRRTAGRDTAAASAPAPAAASAPDAAPAATAPAT